MKVHREDDGRLVICLWRGEDVRSCLEQLAANHGISAARVSAIGAIENPEIGAYDLPRRAYDKRTLEGLYELVSMQGNISLVDGKPFLHAHVALSDHNCAVRGGHLFEAKVGLVLEVFMEPYPTPIARAMDDGIGLARWEPGTPAK